MSRNPSPSTWAELFEELTDVLRRQNADAIVLAGVIWTGSRTACATAAVGAVDTELLVVLVVVLT